MQLLEVEEVEGPATEEPGVFVRSLGAVSFSSPGASGTQAIYDGNARVVSAAPSAGAVFFADSTGGSDLSSELPQSCSSQLPGDFIAVPSFSYSLMPSALAGLFVARLPDLLAAANLDDEDT